MTMATMSPQAEAAAAKFPRSKVIGRFKRREKKKQQQRVRCKIENERNIGVKYKQRAQEHHRDGAHTQDESSQFLSKIN